MQTIVRLTAGYLCLGVLSLTVCADDVPQTSTESVLVENATTLFFEKALFSAERSGLITFVPKEGTRITPGQVVIQLNDTIARAAVRTATERAKHEGEILVAKRAAESAWFEHRVQVEANLSSPDPKNPLVPENTVNRLKLAAEAADARIQQAEEQKQDFELQRDQAQAELEALQVKSHFGGIVTHLHKHQGEGSQLGEPIVEVVNTEIIRVQGTISLAEAYQAKVGMRVVVSAEIPLRDGTIRTVSQEGVLGYIDLKTTGGFDIVSVWAEIPNQESQLKEEMRVKMQIILADPPATRDDRGNIR